VIAGAAHVYAQSYPRMVWNDGLHTVWDVIFPSQTEVRLSIISLHQRQKQSKRGMKLTLGITDIFPVNILIVGTINSKTKHINKGKKMSKIKTILTSPIWVPALITIGILKVIEYILGGAFLITQWLRIFIDMEVETLLFGKDNTKAESLDGSEE